MSLNETRGHSTQIGILGDLHSSFDAVDVAQLDGNGYAALFFVGDLGGYSHRSGLEIARLIATLETPTIVVPGNHDAAHLGQMAAEVLEADGLVRLLDLGQARRERELAEALGPAVLAGYSRHRIDGPQRLDVIVGRPHSTGGPRLAFRPQLERAFGVRDLDASTRRLMQLVDESDAEHGAPEHGAPEQLLFLAHNGPSGLGSSRTSIWGCDFRKAEGDFGDPDLEAAVAHAKATGKTVRAVVAGHMHHHLRGGGTRNWQLEHDGVLYVNAARVPRIFRRGARTLRHHVKLTIESDRISATEVLSS